MAHGRGIYHRQNKTSYEGDFVNDVQEGFGIERWAEGSQYEGRFAGGKKDRNRGLIMCRRTFVPPRR